jgi:DNA modification methylase
MARGVECEHPAVFPVGLTVEAIRTWTDDRDVVWEPFCGSGTTIIAAEQLGRRCYAMEISPVYCDIILARWEKLTGKRAERV